MARTSLIAQELRQTRPFRSKGQEATLTLLRTASVVKRALELNASALILVHNHPSGDPTPSEADIAMTERIRAAAEVLGLTLHDHLIIGKSREVSFRAAGYF